MNEIANQGLGFLLSVTPDQWTAVGTAIAASGVLSPILMWVKKLFKVKRDLLMFGIVVAACFTVVGIAYLKDAVTVNPVYATAIFTLLTNIVYYAIVKPLKVTVAPKAATKWAEAKLYKKTKLAQKQLATIEEEVPGRVQL